MNYAVISGLSKEIQQKLTAGRPETLGQASRIPGVTQAAVSLLMVHLKKRKASNNLEQADS
jgi:tRNA uridine 5-carboxymethylaminomethyl modification enzyme